MMCMKVIFGEVITKVRGARPPVNKELMLTDSTIDPMKPYVHCFCMVECYWRGYNPMAVELSVWMGVGF